MKKWRVAALAIIIVASLLVWRRLQPLPITGGVDSQLVPAMVFDPSEMNAADLFLEERPRSRIRLLKQYYGLTPDRSAPLFREYMDKGVRFFITTQPSTFAVASMRLFADSRALVINTASTSPALTGRDDFILRIIPDAVQEQRALARYVNQLPGGRILLMQDTGNPRYTDPAFALFSAELGALSRWRIVHRKLPAADFKPDDYRALMAEPFDALYILAGDFQSLFQLGGKPPIF